MNQLFRNHLQNSQRPTFNAQVILNVERSELSVESSFEAFAGRAKMADNLRPFELQ
jgi:hypothetical protein